MEKLVAVTVSVPEDRQGQFHVRFGEWLQEWSQASEQAPEGKEGSKAKGGRPPLIPWDGRDKELAKGFQTRVPGNGWRLVSTLCVEGELDEATLIQRLGLENSPQFNGVNGWVGRVSAEFGRSTPTKWKTGDDGARIWFMEPEVAELFKSI